MARRASSTTHPLWIAAILALLAAAMVGGYLVYTFLGNPFRTLAPLPIRDYLENANSLRGNIYRIEGAVGEQLGWSPATGRLFALETEDPDRPKDDPEVVAVLFPASLNHLNIQRGQRLSLAIEVGDRGILKAREVRKS